VPSDVPADFTVTLNGVVLPRGTWGAALETDAGTQEIVARGTRRQPFSKTAGLAEGVTLRVDVEAPRLPTGRLVVTFKAKPGGLVLKLDGAAAEPAAYSQPQDVDVGVHRVDAAAPGYVPFTWRGVLTDGQTTRVDIGLKENQARGSSALTPKWLFFTVGAVGVGALAAATVVAIDTKHRSDDQRALDPALRDPEEKTHIQHQSTLANVLFVSGGLLAIGAGVLTFTTDWSGPPKREKAAATRIGPWASASSGGASVSGVF
jgi:hypothetical protein